ncbi:hypothetical protein Tco_0499515 [Tanacetum coccineum]
MQLSGVHDTFHVSNLKKCLADPTLQVPLDEIRVDAKLNFVEEPVEILEREFKKLKRSRIAIVKVRWNSKRGPEFTWEREDQMKLKYPHLFSDVRDIFKIVSTVVLSGTAGALSVAGITGNYSDVEGGTSIAIEAVSFRCKALVDNPVEQAAHDVVMHLNWSVVEVTVGVVHDE